MFEDNEIATSALTALFPSGVPADASFYERLIDLQLRLGWSEETYRFIGRLLLLATEKLPREEGETVLRLMPDVRNSFFFQLLRALPVVLTARELRPAFAAEWFSALLRRIGNDLGAGGFWTTLEAYCDQHQTAALETLKLLASGTSEDEITAAAYILGVLRRSDLQVPVAEELEQFERELSASAAAAPRAIYHRSWVKSARRGKMSPADMELIVNRMAQGSAEERDELFWVVCRALLSPLMSPECAAVGWERLRERVSSKLSPAAKYEVVDFAANLPGSQQRQAADLIIGVQEILPEHKGIWARVEHFLVSVLENDREFFAQLLMRLAAAGGNSWLRALQDPSQFQWFISELQTADAALAVGQLIVADDSGCREIGLALFDSVGLDTLPPELLQKVDEQQVANAFYESQMSSIDGRAIACFLILLVPLMESATESLREQFYDELVLQSKNYGSCREEFGRRAGEYPVLKQAVDEVERYFEALKRIEESTIAQMRVPGFARAAQLSSRRFANEVSAGAERLSVFAKLFKNVHLLYGREWRTFHDGQLGESSGLKEFSTSVELPRIEFIDPERMQLRRLHAAFCIRQARSGAANEQ